MKEPLGKSCLNDFPDGSCLSRVALGCHLQMKIHYDLQSKTPQKG